MKENQSDRILHWKEYGCECLGTFLLCVCGISAVTFDFAHGLPMERWLPSVSIRLLLTGLLFAGSGSLVAMSPIGKLSGAHLNPSVTLGFWLRKKMHRSDVLGYILAQFIGAGAACMMIGVVWNGFALDVKYGLTVPGPQFGPLIAFGAEFLMTWVYITLIFYFVSHAKLARKTPLMNWLVIAFLVWVEAPISGTSLNAARSFGPALRSDLWSDQWIYFVAPSLGGIVAALTYPLLHRGKDRILTGKLFHSPDYPSIFKNVPHPGLVLDHDG